MRRGAILGAGNVAIHGHLPGWLARGDVEIVAAADPRAGGRAALQERLPKARWYDSAEELLSRETLDFVDICAPPAMHAPLIAASLARGLHVLCEKPLVLSVEELRPLAHSARANGRVLATVHNWRHAPILAAVGDLVERGAVGRVLDCRWETLRQRPAAVAGEGEDNWRVDPSISGGGILMDHGWHALYVVLAWLPAPPARIAARLTAAGQREGAMEDTAEVRLEWLDGGTAEIFLTWTGNERANRVRIEGTRGRIELDGRGLEVSTGGPRPSGRREFAGSLSEGSHHPDWFGGSAAEFVSEIQDPARRGRSLEEAFRCLESIALARESSRRGGEAIAFQPEAAPGARRLQGSLTT